MLVVYSEALQLEVVKMDVSVEDEFENLELTVRRGGERGMSSAFLRLGLILISDCLRLRLL